MTEWFGKYSISLLFLLSDMIGELELILLGYLHSISQCSQCLVNSRVSMNGNQCFLNNWIDHQDKENALVSNHGKQKVLMAFTTGMHLTTYFPGWINERMQNLGFLKAERSSQHTSVVRWKATVHYLPVLSCSWW